jgi:hypothetical protein
MADYDVPTPDKDSYIFQLAVRALDKPAPDLLVADRQAYDAKWACFEFLGKYLADKPDLKGYDNARRTSHKTLAEYLETYPDLKPYDDKQEDPRVLDPYLADKPLFRAYHDVRRTGLAAVDKYFAEKQLVAGYNKARARGKDALSEHLKETPAMQAYHDARLGLNSLAERLAKNPELKEYEDARNKGADALKTYLDANPVLTAYDEARRNSSEEDFFDHQGNLTEYEAAQNKGKDAVAVYVDQRPSLKAYVQANQPKADPPGYFAKITNLKAYYEARKNGPDAMIQFLGDKTFLKAYEIERQKCAWELAEYVRDKPELMEYEELRTQGAEAMANYLADKPRLQEQLAFSTDYVPSRWLLSRELPAVVARRKIHALNATAYDSSDDPYKWAKDGELQGICFSGGGIRSATFNLGILQGLAKKRMLHRFDYLSSVSGGGYIHEWLAGWIKREEGKQGEELDATEEPNPLKRTKDTSRGGLRRVQNRLQPLPSGKQLPFQPEPIRWLRRYSNYLTPQKGVFTADTWVAIAIWTRNTFLNQLILASGLFFLVLFPHLISPSLQAIGGCFAQLGAGAFFLLASFVMWTALHREYDRVRHFDMYGEQPARRPSAKFGAETMVQASIVLPLLCASALFLINLASGVQSVGLLVAVFLALTTLIAGIALAGGAVRSYKVNHGLISGYEKKKTDGDKLSGRQHVVFFARGSWHLGLHYIGLDAKLSEDGEKAEKQWKVFFSAILSSVVFNAALSAAAGMVLLLAIWWVLGVPLPCFLADHLPPVHPWHLPMWVSSSTESYRDWRVRLAIGPPLFLAVPFFSMILAAGLVGRNYPDWLREWLARVRAWSFLFALGWLAYFGISLLGPSIFGWFETTQYHKLAASIKWSTILVWLSTTAGSVMAGNSKKASGTPQDSSVALNLLAEVGPYVFILGLLVMLSGIADWGFHQAYGDPLGLTLLVLLPLAIFVLFGWRVDVNDFSMNSFYRNRLTRCYLGASNPQRDPNPLTGFDDRDTQHMQISKLKPSDGYSGPLPIVCTAMNLSFGEDLAWQERKAASFAFSPLYSGYTVGWTSGKGGRRLSFNGFVPTADYYQPDGGINMSTAVAISGAAASPNWGYHSNPATAFLMTIFNVRLGWWIFNPRRSTLAGCLPNPILPGDKDGKDNKPEWPSPRFAPLELTKELLGMTDDTSKYVYLSDGGHFDNMGLYELVRRRCYRIVICDAEQDEHYTFEGIGMAIRKCRVDFGAEINLNLDKLRPNAKTGLCKAHSVLGSIRYPETAPGEESVGKILYLKASITGSRRFHIQGATNPDALVTPEPSTQPEEVIEPVDILNYRLQHASFPHDSTLNQWFTESMFESYRRLGQQVVECCTDWSDFSGQETIGLE